MHLRKRREPYYWREYIMLCLTSLKSGNFITMLCVALGLDDKLLLFDTPSN